MILMLSVITLFTLRSFASPETGKPSVEPSSAQECTGTLTVKAGQVSINGNAAQTGATVLSGSIISTNSNGKAIIDLGGSGRVEIGDHTTATLTCAAGSIEIRTIC